METSVFRLKASAELKEIKSTFSVPQVVPARAEVLSGGDNELERSIKAAMMRMKKVAADSDDEGDEDCQNPDWDS